MTGPDTGRIGQERGSLNAFRGIIKLCDRQAPGDDVGYTLAVAAVHAGYPKSKFFRGFRFGNEPIIGKNSIRAQIQGFITSRNPAFTPDDLCRTVYGVPVAGIVCLAECNDPAYDSARRFQMYSAFRSNSR